ncbi:MAG: hypothetical protein HYZ42_17750, partial [Bacteroidetes bacterium]|nr:hypothetical protein [Bacteroidota bacterium]
FPSLEYYNQQLRKPSEHANSDILLEEWPVEISSDSYETPSFKPLKNMEVKPYLISFNDLTLISELPYMHDDKYKPFVFLNESHYKKVNLYIKLGEGIYIYDLKSIIDPSQYQAFNNYIFSKLSKIENLNFPCIPSSDFIKFFNPNFMLNDEQLILINGERNEFKMPISEVLPFFSEWAKKTMFSGK